MCLILVFIGKLCKSMQIRVIISLSSLGEPTTIFAALLINIWDHLGWHLVGHSFIFESLSINFAIRETFLKLTIIFLFTFLICSLEFSWLSNTNPRFRMLLESWTGIWPNTPNWFRHIYTYYYYQRQVYILFCHSLVWVVDCVSTDLLYWKLHQVYFQLQ